MKLTCPGCGGVYSADAWENDANVRRFEGAVAGLPAPVAQRIRAYLALFRPASGRGLGWRRAVTLAEELGRLVRAGHVQWKRRPARPCTPAHWAGAMDMIIQRPPNRLPIESHGYLTSIAYDIADQADRSAEVTRNRAERTGAIQAQRVTTTDGAEPIDPEWLRAEADRKLKRRRRE